MLKIEYKRGGFFFILLQQQISTMKLDQNHDDTVLVLDVPATLESEAFVVKPQRDEKPVTFLSLPGEVSITRRDNTERLLT